MLRYSLPTLNWLRYPEPDADVGAAAAPVPTASLDQILDAAATAGFSAIGLDTTTVARHVALGGRIDELGTMLSERALECSDVGVLLLGQEGSIPSARQLADLAEATGATICIAAQTVATTPLTLRDARACASILRAAGARLALEFVPYTGLRTLDEARAVCEATGWDDCGLLVDTWHFFNSGAPWPALRSLAGDKIALVHANDAPVPLGDDLASESRFRRVPVGAGTFAIDEFVEVMRVIRYEGAISCEVLSSNLQSRPPREAAQELIDALRRHWPLDER